MFEQDRVLVRLQQYVLREDEILVCFLAGSYGRGAQDPFSDLDVIFVYQDDARRETAYARRRDIVQAVLPYVPAYSFDAAHVRPYFHIALYSNGAKVDYRFETLQSLEPSPWQWELRLLKDTNGWGQQFQAASASQPAAAPQPTITTAELTALDSRLWVMFMDIYRQLLRGDHDKPFPIYLQILYFTLPELLGLLPAEDPAHQALLQASYSHDTQATLTHLRRLFDAYLDARAAVIRRHNLAFTPDRAFEFAIQKIIQKG
ncbi:MAG: nucleotidyltransferase domain-containing protein [Chloroflexi bacterium]|nr:nucleotidyltransferase domain-containing protein [Chloroflexota bacterium]MCI0577079.1 nucleotidyltransferase domain-containing protein [Chloroflexota bacterium]MCI0650155.1 nucleotidyltransferase domain-containing protein [Chloroflexota bacterium]MCI0728010.1 nucleotidyltransferase domain-containing protein [Chloroflexota bacterium]